MRSSLSCRLLGATFVATGTLHFAVPGFYQRIMPPYLPFHRELVYFSGAAEALGGLGMFSMRTSRAARIWLILVLLAVWPANLQMFLDARAAGKPRWWANALLIRLPLQIPLMLWAWGAAQGRDARGE